MEAEPASDGVSVEDPPFIPDGPETVENPSAAGEQEQTKEFGQSDRIEDAGSPTHVQPQGPGPQDTPKEGRSE